MCFVNRNLTMLTTLFVDGDWRWVSHSLYGYSSCIDRQRNYFCALHVYRLVHCCAMSDIMAPCIKKIDKMTPTEQHVTVADL